MQIKDGKIVKILDSIKKNVIYEEDEHDSNKERNNKHVNLKLIDGVIDIKNVLKDNVESIDIQQAETDIAVNKKVETPKVETDVTTDRKEIIHMGDKSTEELIESKGTEKQVESKGVEEQVKSKGTKEQVKSKGTEEQVKSITVDEKEVKHMEKEATEKQIEDILKQRDFLKNIEESARFIGDSKGKIDNISKSVKYVEGELGNVDKSVKELCTGIDCIKEDMNKFQNTTSILEKHMQEKFGDLGNRLEKLEQPMFMCESCGEDGVKALSSYCPNCGSPIHEWTDDRGTQVKGWVPYWKRAGRITP